MVFELQPHLKGGLIELRPLKPDDWDELFAVASDSLIWEQHPERDRYKEDAFRVFFKEALESGGAFVIIDRKSRQMIGSTRFYGYDPEKSEIEIGWTFLGRKYWGGRYNAEMKRLLSLTKGHGKSWRDQSRNGDANVRKSSAYAESEVRDQEILTAIGPAWGSPNLPGNVRS